MRSLAVLKKFFCFLFFLSIVLKITVCESASPPRMRPYTGVGLVLFTQNGNSVPQDLQIPLYEEPGILRVGMLNSSKLPGNEWIFDYKGLAAPLIVSARKGDWLRVFYDDAGREGWISPDSRGRFVSWEQFLKLQTNHLLSGLQSQYYQLLQKPGGKVLLTLTPKQVFKVLKVENSWSMVMVGQAQIGWLRWSDDDSRLLFGF